MTKSSIYRLISIIIELADKIDDNFEFWEFTVNQTLEIGLGCRALSSYLRRGAKDIITLQEDYQRAKEKEIYSRADAESCRKLLEDIFGDTDADEIILDEWKPKFRMLYEELSNNELEDIKRADEIKS